MPFAGNRLVSLDTLLSRLEGVHNSGHRRWRGRCPAHVDRNPSLSVRELDDGRLLVHCFAGCDIESVVSAVGLGLSDLFPDQLIQHRLRALPKPLLVSDVVRCLQFELEVAWIVMADIAAGRIITAADRERADIARDRIRRFLSALEHATP